MNLVGNQIPTSYAVELMSLGLDMQDAGIDAIPCRVPCIETNGILIPTMEGARGKYPMHPFVIGVESDESTGGGFVSLTPEPSDQYPDSLIGMPIYKPDEAENRLPFAFRQIVGSRIGYAALRSSFGIETITDPRNGRDRYAGMTVLSGILQDGTETTLFPEPMAASFYMGLLKNVGAAKFAKILEQQRLQAATLPKLPAKLALAV